MNLYEFEARQLFAKHGIAVPKGIVVRRGDDFEKAYSELGAKDVVVKAQILSGKRGKSGGIKFCSSAGEVKVACEELFNKEIKNQYVAAVLIAEKLEIAEEHYLSITYDTKLKQPVIIYSKSGGMDIEEVDEREMLKKYLDVREGRGGVFPSIAVMQTGIEGGETPPLLYDCFLAEDCRVVEINPLVKTKDGKWYAADAKMALDDDAFFRHEEWKNYEPRTMLGRPATEREVEVRKIDEGESYYRGTAGKYIEMDGDIAVLFSGGGASIANMDALFKAGLKPANYTEYSGNPPREKVYKLTKVVLSKPNLRGLWIVGGVANFTDIAETFHGIVDALDEIKPQYPIVIRRAGPNEDEGMKLMRECAERNGLRMKIFGKEVSMSETAGVLARMIK